MRHTKTESIAAPEPAVDWPLVVISFLTGLFFLVFVRLLILRHNNFYTFDYDLGIFDQATWLLSRGESFITVRGLHVFGHHANFGLLLLVPFYWLGAGPNFLNVFMVATVALGVLPLYRYSLQLLDDPWHALIPPLAYLAHFSSSWMLQETFHPEVVAIAPLMLAYVASTKQQWRSYAIWLLLAGVWKEDLALAVLMIGAIVFMKGHRRIGLITSGAALVYFVLVIRVMIPALTDGGVFYEKFFGELGSGALEIIANAIRQPSLVVAAFRDHDALGYLRDLLLPFAFVPLAGPTPLLVGLPQFVANMLSVQFSHGVRVHYAAVPLAAVSLALVEGLSRLKRIGLRRFALGGVAALTATTSVLWGLLPWGIPYDQGNWSLEPSSRAATFDGALSFPGSDDAVVATFNLVPHLTHRRHIYTFPNPWAASNWGTGVEPPPDPSFIDWLVIDRSTLGELTDDFERILAEERWEIVFERDSIVVARRGS